MRIPRHDRYPAACDRAAVDAIERLLVSLRPKMLAMANRILGDLHDAEDAVQIAGARAWAARGRILLRPSTSLSSWLLTILYRTCLDALKARRVRSRYFPRSVEVIESSPNDEHLLADPSPIPCEIIIRDETARTLRAAIDSLTPALRAAALLELADVDVAEESRRTGTSCNTLSSSRRRAHNALREILGDFGAEEAGPSPYSAYVIEYMGCDAEILRGCNAWVMPDSRGAAWGSKPH